MSRRPRIALLCDRPGWAYDRAAQGLRRALGAQFEFDVRYVVDRPEAPDCDLLHVFFWGETWQRRWGLPPQRVVKEISSHRWNEAAYGSLTPPEFVAQHLADAASLTTTSRRLQRIVAPLRPVHFAPNGVDLDLFAPGPAPRPGALRVGWAGNGNDPCKGLHDVLAPACRGRLPLLLADGGLEPQTMGAFYRALDVLVIASTAEGEPLTLLEAMACGCFPVATDVGIVPELVRHGDDGLCVERRPAAFRAALQWCEQNLGFVRRAGAANAVRVRQQRSWDAVAGHWQQAWRAALAGAASRTAVALPDNREFNLGARLGEWPDRAAAAAALVAALQLPAGAAVVDLGCGRQTVRPLLPKGLRYHPVDWLPRSDDTEVMDLAVRRPAGRYDAALMLGLLEYFPCPEALLQWAAQHCGALVFSYADTSDPERRQRQHWSATASHAQIEAELQRLHGGDLQHVEVGRGQRLYCVRFAAATTADGAGPVLVPAQPAAAAAPRRPQRIALFSAGVAMSNSGDALIEHTVRRLCVGVEFERLPLLQPLDGEQLERANACDLGIVCGTNLYQHVLACALDEPALRRLRLPLLPLGIGGSTAVGGRIAMDAASVRAVRMLHERCAVGSVRDLQAYEFVRSLGVRNVELTGCPVLFHGGQAPDFTGARPGALSLSLRARLLHVAPELQQRALRLYGEIARRQRPQLVLQSRHDQPIAQALAARFSLHTFADPEWQEGALLAALAATSATVGLRLHFAMLCLSHGVPAALVGTDTRTQGFCALLGLPFFDLATCTPAAVLDAVHGGTDFSTCVRRWRQLQRSMHGVLQQNGLRCRWDQLAEIGPLAAAGVRS